MGRNFRDLAFDCENRVNFSLHYIFAFRESLGMRLAELTGLSSFRKLRKLPRYVTGPNFASAICSGSTFFYLWEVVQIFQRVYWTP